jgi:LDH2 family malate/lactate/ureidoglycolate dehydrogenase
MSTRMIPYERLIAIADQALAVVGTPSHTARRVATLLAPSEAEGAVSHGLARLPPLMRRIQAGLVDVHAEPEVVIAGPATAVIDAHHGIGLVVADTAMALATKKAREYGIGAVTVRNSSHFGRASHFASQAADVGMLGLAASNASPRLVPGPGAEPVLGNNPWAFAWPSDEGPFCVDMANSVVAAGKLRTAVAEGRPIPLGWAIDEEGSPTRDPSRGLAGALLAMGGHKGWAISLVIDIISGGLANGAMGPEVASLDNMGRRQAVAHFFMAVNVEHFCGISEFSTRMSEFANELSARSGTDARMPGEASKIHRERSLADGIPVSVATLTEIEHLTTTLGQDG